MSKYYNNNKPILDVRLVDIPKEEFKMSDWCRPIGTYYQTLVMVNGVKCPLDRDGCYGKPCINKKHEGLDLRWCIK